MDVGTSRAIVTGAASGIGREVCAGLLHAGGRVAAMDTDQAGLDRLATALAGRGDALTTHRVDVRDEQQVSAAVDCAFAGHPGVNVLVNSAGVYRDGLVVKALADGVVKMPLGQWRAVVDADLTGTFLMAREVAAQWLERGTRPAVVVNVSSVSRSGNRGQANYSAAKAGVVAFTRTMALELAPHGIRSVAIAPGFVDTPILAAMDSQRLAEQVEAIPARRLGTVGELFLGVRFAIECEYFNGRCLEIDGGLDLMVGS